MIRENKQIRFNRTMRAEKPIYIVIHDTGNTDKGADADRHFAYFDGGNRGSSADFFVDDKKALQVNDYTKYYTWHCGDGRGKYGITNANSIGIEMCINSDGDYEKAFEDTIALTKELMDKLGIPAERVVRHYDASRKNCPQSMSANDWAKWKEFKQRLTEGDEITVTQYEELKKEIEKRDKRIEALETKVGKQGETYDYIDENMPAWVKDDVKWMRDRSIIVGDDEGKLGLNPIKMWTLCIVARTAKYLAKLIGVKM